MSNREVLDEVKVQGKVTQASIMAWVGIVLLFMLALDPDRSWSRWVTFGVIAAITLWVTPNKRRTARWRARYAREREQDDSMAQGDVPGLPGGSQPPAPGSWEDMARADRVREGGDL